MKKRSVLIADDEPNARDFLSRLIQEDERVELMGAFGNGLEVLKYCRTHVPNILILDIEMPGLSGIETAKKLMENNKSCVIIFVTAFDQYAIEAFDLMAIGYLLKPYSMKDVSKVLSRAIQNIDTNEKQQFGERIEKLWQHYNKSNQVHLNHLEIKEKGLLIKVAVSDILYIASDSEYIRIHSIKSMYMKRQSLSMIISQLPSSFMQIHRTFIINLDHVKSWKYLNNGTYQFKFGNGQGIKSSRSFKESIKSCSRLNK